MGKLKIAFSLLRFNFGIFDCSVHKKFKEGHVMWTESYWFK